MMLVLSAIFKQARQKPLHTLITNTVYKGTIYWTWNICFNSTETLSTQNSIADEFENLSNGVKY
jgi:hypothetical protein